MKRLAGKTAIVTGGARGMGAVHVRRFLSEGASVVFTDVRQDEGHALQKELEGKARFLPHDVTSLAEWRSVIGETESLFGPVEILVNNAGVVAKGSIEDFDENVYRNVIEINQTGVFLGMKAVIPSMRTRGSGSIINISSITGLIGRTEAIAYVASKFAVRGMTKAAAMELGSLNIRVNSVHPGAVNTEMFASIGQKIKDELTSELPIKRAAEPDEVSSMLVFLASDESAYCTGAEFVIDGGFTCR